MKSLIKIFFLLLAVFLILTILVTIVTGGLTVEQIQVWLEKAGSVSPIYIGIIITGLLLADLFIAMPTLTICILSGFFLGFQAGTAFSLLGVGLAGTSGYLITRFFGRGFLNRIARSPEKVREMEEIFEKNGVVVILLSRALPILPEISACLSGLTKMPAPRFLLAWFASSLPYVAIAAYAGSVSTIDSPLPAILTAIVMCVFFWTMWVILLRRNRKIAAANACQESP